jgi:DNA repair protein RadC
MEPARAVIGSGEPAAIVNPVGNTDFPTPGLRRSHVQEGERNVDPEHPASAAAHLPVAGRAASSCTDRRTEAGSPASAGNDERGNSMNLSMLDREQLEAIVLDPSRTDGEPHRCCDADPGPVADETTRDRRLRHVLAAAHELLVRIAHQAVVGRRFLNAPSLAKDYLMVLFAGAEQEMFVVVFLDAHIRVIAAETTFTGTLTQTSVYPREIVRRALRHNAASVVLAHNHPLC